tara:strand:- start:96 stop:803 length:708 start_codon:yes stop_codon:yes gene_type:complete
MDNTNEPTMNKDENNIDKLNDLEEVTDDNLLKNISKDENDKDTNLNKEKEEKDDEQKQDDEEKDGEQEQDDEESSEEKLSSEEDFENMKEEESDGDNNSDSEESSDEEDESYFRKIENDNKKDILLDYHPEIQHLKTTEMLAMTKIYRNENGIINDNLHKTSPILTRFEKARVIGLRAKQINMGAEPFIEVPDDIIDGLTIAEMELQEKKIPFIIRRPMPNGGSEYWNLKDLILL